MSTKEIQSKNARFDTRLPQEQKAFFEKAAQLGGYRNLTDFVVKATNEKAKEIILENERILSSRKDNEIFFEAILNPQKPNKALSKAAKEFELMLK